MARIISVKDRVNNLEVDLARIKFVQTYFPNIKLQQENNKNYIFSDKNVANNFTYFVVMENYDTITLSLIKELEFNFNGKSEKILIHSIPKQKYICGSYSDYKKTDSNGNYIRKIDFGKPFKCKDKNLTKKVQDACRLEIIKYIQARPKLVIDENVLDPKIKKLIHFI